MPLLLPSTYNTVISCIFVYKWHKIAMGLYALYVLEIIVQQLVLIFMKEIVMGLLFSKETSAT